MRRSCHHGPLPQRAPFSFRNTALGQVRSCAETSILVRPPELRDHLADEVPTPSDRVAPSGDGRLPELLRAFEVLAQETGERRGIDRSPHVFHAPRIAGDVRGILGTKATCRDDRNTSRRWIASQLLGQYQPAQLREHQIQHNRLGIERNQERDGLLGAPCDPRLAAVCFESRRDDARARLLVLDDQYGDPNEV